MTPARGSGQIARMDRTQHILLVDDNADSRDLCRGLLKSEGYHISEAISCRAAVEAVRDHKPDLMIVNVTMTNKEGLECTRNMKADPTTRDIPIMHLTLTEEDIAAGVQVGADDYIVKPLSHREFILRVRSLPHVADEKLLLVRSRDLLGEHVRASSVLVDFAGRLAAASEIEDALDEILFTTSQLLACRRVSIMFPDREGKALVVARSIGMPEEIAASIRVPVGVATAGQVFQSGKTFVANTAGQHSSHRYDSELFVSIPLVSIALHVNERTVGVLNATQRHGERPFEPVELEYVNLISQTAASVLDGLLTRIELDDARDSLVVALAKLAEYRDGDTGRHLDRVTRFALMLAQELRGVERLRNQIDEQFLADLKRTVPLHDIGKVAIPDHILLKPGKLTPQEMVIMKRHAEVGAATIRSVSETAPGTRFLRMAEDVAHAHHEWYDGSGYPRGLKGDDIPLAARIAALADVYDAVTTKRPYKEPMSHEKAVAIIREQCGSQFDPVVVEAFLQREREFAHEAERFGDDAPTPNRAVAEQERNGGQLPVCAPVVTGAV